MVKKSNLEVASKFTTSVLGASKNNLDLKNLNGISQDNTSVKNTCINLYDSSKSILNAYLSQVAIDSERIKMIGLEFDNLDRSIKSKWEN